MTPEQIKELIDVTHFSYQAGEYPSDLDAFTAKFLDDNPDGGTLVAFQELLKATEKLEAIREELSIYSERLYQAREDWLEECKNLNTDAEKEQEWLDQLLWAQQGAPVDLEKIVEILDD